MIASPIAKQLVHSTLLPSRSVGLCCACAVQLAAEQAKLALDFSQFRMSLLMLWIVSNLGLSFVVLYFGYLSDFGLAIAIIICITMGMRIVGRRHMPVPEQFLLLPVGAHCRIGMT